MVVTVRGLRVNIDVKSEQEIIIMIKTEIA